MSLYLEKQSLTYPCLCCCSIWLAIFYVTQVLSTVFCHFVSHLELMELSSIESLNQLNSVKISYSLHTELLLGYDHTEAVKSSRSQMKDMAAVMLSGEVPCLH